MEDIIIRKLSPFAGLLDLIKRIFKKEEKIYEYARQSKFQHYLGLLEQNDPMFEKCVQAAGLCEEALRIARQRLLLARRIQETDEKIEELDCFFRLSDEDASQLKELLDRFVSLTKERNALIYQLTGFDRSLSNMMNLEEDAAGAISSISDAEKTQRILKQDIGFLEGERADLAYEQSLLEFGLMFISRFSVCAVVLFGFACMFLGYLFMAREVSIFLPTTVLVLLAIAVAALLHMFRKRMTYELKMNMKKQQRAAHMLNKKNVVCVYYTNFLRFEYSKYKVRNSQMLKTNLKDYKNYKHITLRVDAIRKIMYETEKQIEQFLRANNIGYAKYMIEQFAQTVNVADKMEYVRELANEKIILEKNLLDLDDKHTDVWELLESIAAEDATEEKIVDGMIQTYFSEVSNMLRTIDKAEEAV